MTATATSATDSSAVESATIRVSTSSRDSFVGSTTANGLHQPNSLRTLSISSIRSTFCANPNTAHCESQINRLSMENGHFVDMYGRVQILRGVNLGGSSKLPTTYVQGSHQREKLDKFYDNAPHVSFVGRPFPLEEADVHFARLSRWGLNFLRFIITWEAIEHEGPGIYDYEYIQYIRKLMEKAQEYGLLIYIDPHQDVWSRWTGGDGAPMWTLECIGLEPRHFEVTKASICIETFEKKPSEFPKMIWPTNYFKFACATMFTLFWGGNKFAPKCHVNGIPVQVYLQNHYINAMIELAKALKGLDNIVGFGTMNEPSAGYIGVKDLSKHFFSSELKYGFAPTPFQGMALADGFEQTIEFWSNGFNQHVLGRPDRFEKINPNGLRAWKPNHRCVWLDEKIWEIDSKTDLPVLKKPFYFANQNFGQDFYVPFAMKFINSLREILPQAFLFVELPPLEFNMSSFPEIDPKKIPMAVNATHWYDGVTLFLRSWRPYFTVDPQTKRPYFLYRNVQKLHKKQLRHIKDFGKNQMYNAPTLIGETGIPFNLNDGKAFLTGDFSDQTNALDNTISCLEANLLSYTLWCYTSDNCNDFGDQWNLEDLSILSINHEGNEEEEKENLDVGGRAMDAFIRPHAMKIAGLPIKSLFSRHRVRYELEYETSNTKQYNSICHIDHDEQTITEVYVPLYQYPKGYNVTLSGGKYQVHKKNGWDLIMFFHDEKATYHKLLVTSKDPKVVQKLEKQDRQLKILLLLGVLSFILVLVFIFY